MFQKLCMLARIDWQWLSTDKQPSKLRLLWLSIETGK